MGNAEYEQPIEGQPKTIPLGKQDKNGRKPTHNCNICIVGSKSLYNIY